jgi:guanine deaminase
MEKRFMEQAIKKAEDNIALGGGPFGAVIVKDGQIVALGNNRVTLTNDPTAHAEVTAIREACKVLNTFDLSGCEIYTSCEPCPMCLSAIYWARIEKIYYGNTKTDAKNIGFDDSFIYDEIEKNPADRAIPAVQFMAGEALKAFTLWEGKDDKVPY